MKPSKYQAAIFDWVKAAAERPKAALLVEAVAGSGKTTTIVEALKVIPWDQSVLFLAFNRHIADELKRRMPMNAEAKTVNSYGWQACRAAVPGVQLAKDGEKTRMILERLAPGKRQWIGPMSRIIGLKKANLDVPADVLASRYDVNLPEDEEEFLAAAALVWKESIRQQGFMDFDDQWMFPVLRNFPVREHDWVFVDEAQDLSATQVALIRRIAPRIVAVGDPWQSIYGFRGADPDAMDRLEHQVGAERLPLSICYRCPKSVVREAKSIVQHIEHHDEQIDGEVRRIGPGDLIKEAKPGDWVLCRTTAPLVGECIRFVMAGKKASVKGRDIGKDLLTLVDRVSKRERSMDAVAFASLLREYRAHEVARLEEAGREAQMQSLEDKCDSIEALSQGARTVQEVADRIEHLFRDENSPGVTFATAHRSKGLEADDVYVIRPDQMPLKTAKSEWAMKQEMNLKYVTITRAKRRLTWVQ